LVSFVSPCGDRIIYRHGGLLILSSARRRPCASDAISFLNINIRVNQRRIQRPPVLQADDMPADRHVYERSLPNSVKRHRAYRIPIDRELRESSSSSSSRPETSMPRWRQVKRHVADGSEADAPRQHPALDPRASMPRSFRILQLAISERKDVRTQIFDSALNFIRPAMAPVPGPRCRFHSAQGAPGSRPI